jgi:hypothetical protein
MSGLKNGKSMSASASAGSMELVIAFKTPLAVNSPGVADQAEPIPTIGRHRVE